MKRPTVLNICQVSDNRPDLLITEVVRFSSTSTLPGTAWTSLIHVVTSDRGLIPNFSQSLYLCLTSTQLTLQSVNVSHQGVAKLLDAVVLLHFIQWNFYPTPLAAGYLSDTD